MSELKTQTDVRFRPVECQSEQKMKETSPHEGYVYFTLDTKKIFLGTENDFVPMSVSTGLFYGLKDIAYDNSGTEPDPNVVFNTLEIEGDMIPQKDDLILNTDGCFYRVNRIEESDIYTKRLTLQGSGGTGPSGPSAGASFAISIDGSKNKYFSSQADSAIIAFKSASSDSDNTIISVVCTFESGEVIVAHENLNWPVGKLYEIDLIKHLHKFSSVAKKVQVDVTDSYLTTRSLTFSISKVELELTTNDQLLFAVNEDVNEFRYTCNLSGAGNLKTDKKINYTIYEDGNEMNVLYEDSISFTSSGDITKNINVSNLPVGVYIFTIQAEGKVEGNDTLITSNMLTHKILRANSSTTLFSAFVGEKLEQYTNIPITYLLATTADSGTYEMNILVDGGTYYETSLNIVANQLSTYNLMFEDVGSYALELQVPDLGHSYTTILNIAKYTGNLPVIDTNNDALELYLNPRGKTNDDVNKDKWDSHDKKQQAQLENFYFGQVNGWSTDDQNAAYLKISQGAKVKMPAYRPFKVDAMGKSSEGVMVELDFKVSGILDYSSELIKCVSRISNGVTPCGFSVTGNSFKVFTSNHDGDTIIENGKEVYKAPLSLSIVEDKRIRLTLLIERASSNQFPMIYIYLNGILSYANNYISTENAIGEKFTDSLDYPATLEIDSTYGQIDLYGFRVYSTAQKEKVILNNLQASYSTLEERERSYLDNNIYYDDKDEIDFNLVAQGDYPLSIPYIKITGGYKYDKDAKLMAAEGADIFALPIGKKDYRLIDFELVYPKNMDYFKQYEDFSEITTFEDKTLNVTNGFGKKPLTGAYMYAQGTSSLEYPVKNLRIKYLSKKINVTPELSPVNLICLKADYMESSGSHNTGAGNYIDNCVYSPISLDNGEIVSFKTPAQEYYQDEEIVTCIKGHPCVIFWSPTGEEGSYQYIGKYNLNLDKATPEPFGFKHDTKEDVLEATQEHNIDAVKFGYEVDENGSLVLQEVVVNEETGETKTIKKNSIYCFEFLDNAVKVCNFLPKNGKDYYTTWYEEVFYDEKGNRLEKSHYGWTEGFESRFPEDADKKNDADALYPLASWINELYNLRTSGREKEALARFENEYQCYLNKEFLMAYYLVTDTLLMADSRTKNMMIATWGKEKRSYNELVYDESTQTYSATGEKKSTFNYIWYPIFYDMDTMMGLDNTGQPRFSYYSEDTDPLVFNGDEVLWNFVRDALPGDVMNYYSKLESNAFSESIILPKFNDNQADMANEAFYNGDAKYKYIRPFRSGYRDHLNNVDIAPGKSTRLYAAQGDRSLNREYIIKNRIKFQSGKHRSSRYQSSDRIEFRVNYPKKDGNLSEQLLKSIEAVAPNNIFNFTSLKSGYAGVKIGQNGTIVNNKFNGRETIEFDHSAVSGANGTEAYILGLSNLVDLGDLSTKYVQNFQLMSDDIRLESLQLGNDHRDYFNPFWGSSNVDTSQMQSGTVSLEGCKYLKDFNLINCSSFSQNLNFMDCTQIEKINIIGSGTTSLALPVGGVLQELRIPTTISGLYIEGHEFLTKDNFTWGYYNYAPGQNRIRENLGEYINDYSRVREIVVKNTPIDSYTIALQASRNDIFEYQFQGVVWEINKKEDLSINAQNELIGIKVLDQLLKKDTYGTVTRAESLTGELVIKNLPDVKVNEYQIYEKYQGDFPNLSIKYEGLDITPAIKISFYNSETINENSEPYYTVLSDAEQSYTLGYLTSAEGPNKFALPEPFKLPTNEYAYAFNGVWVDASTGVEYTAGSESFDNFIPSGSMNFVPRFTEAVRYYKASFYDYDRSLIWQDDKLTYGQIYGDYQSLSQGYIPQFVYRDDSSLEQFERYSFKGWKSQKDFNNEVANPKFYDLDTLKVQSDNFVAYAHYEIEDVQTVTTDLKYFDFSYKDDGENSIIKRYAISVKPKYKNILAGKITLPVKDSKGNDIEAISDFSCPLISMVYIPQNSSYRYVLKKAFYDNSNLSYINLPEQIVQIAENAFERCTKIEMDHLPSELSFLGQMAFYYATSRTLTINSLPNTLISIGQSAFQGTHVIVTELGQDDNTDGKVLKKIPANTFWVDYYTEKSKGPLILKRSIEEVHSNAFTNCFDENGIDVIFYEPITEDMLIAAGVPIKTASQLI